MSQRFPSARHHPVTPSARCARATLPQPAAALVTLLFTASGATLLGIGSAFWGLVAGLARLGLDAWRR